jgi:hypothetical protein
MPVKHLAQGGLHELDVPCPPPLSNAPLNSPPPPPYTVQIMLALRDGRRLPIPPREALPGPDTAGFAGWKRGDGEEMARVSISLINCLLLFCYFVPHKQSMLIISP